MQSSLVHPVHKPKYTPQRTVKERRSIIALIASLAEFLDPCFGASGMLFWNGPSGKVCFEPESSTENVKISNFLEFIVVANEKQIFLFNQSTFKLLDKCMCEATVVALNKNHLKLANESVLEIVVETGKIKLKASTEQYPMISKVEKFIASNPSGTMIQLKSNDSTEIVSEISGKSRTFLWLNTHTLLSCWREGKKCYLSALQVLSSSYPSNSSVLPFIMWSDKQIFAHRGPLYSSWLHLQRSELIDVIDSQIGNIKMVSSSEDCKSLVVLNEDGQAAVCDFTRRLWRPVQLTCVKEVRFLNSQFLILCTSDTKKLYLISLTQTELFSTSIPLEAEGLNFFACSSDGNLIVQVGDGVHVFAFTALPSQRQIHFTNSFTCRLQENEQLEQAATQSGFLYLLNPAGIFSVISLNTGKLVAQFKNISTFLCFDEFVLVKKGANSWCLYWNSRLFDLTSRADAIYPQLPGIVAISTNSRSFSLSSCLNSTFLLPKMFRFTGQLRLLERSKQNELVLEYLVLECLSEPELLRQMDEFFVGSLEFARAIVKCCRKIEVFQAAQIFAHFFNFSPGKMIQLLQPADCLLFLPFLVNTEDEVGIKQVLSKLTGLELQEAQSFLENRRRN